MKKTIFFLFILPFWAIGQTPTENYVKTTTYNGEQATLPKSKWPILTAWDDRYSKWLRDNPQREKTSWRP